MSVAPDTSLPTVPTVARLPDPHRPEHAVLEQALQSLRGRLDWPRAVQQAAPWRVEVRDDGVGFDATVPSRSAYGLVGMRFRVEAEGGKLLVTSTPGHGTRLVMTLPAAADRCDRWCRGGWRDASF